MVQKTQMTYSPDNTSKVQKVVPEASRVNLESVYGQAEKTWTKPGRFI